MEKILKKCLSIYLPMYLGICVITEMSNYRQFSITNLIEKVLFMGLIILAIMNIFFIKFTRKQIFITFVVLILLSTLLIFFDYVYVGVILISISISQLDIKKIIKRIFLCTLIASGFVVISFFLEIIPQYIMYRNGMPRYSIGFYHPNTVGVLFFILVSQYIYIKEGNISFFKTILIFFMSLGVSEVTDSRTTFFITMILLVLNLITRFIPINILSKIYKITFIIPFLLMFVTLVISIEYDYMNPDHFQLNKLLSGRLYFLNYYFNQYGINWFGHRDILIIGTKEASESFGLLKGVILDNSFLLFLLRYGIITACTILSLFTYLIYDVVKRKEFYFATILVCFLLLGLSESYVFNFRYNIYLLLLMVPFFMKKR